MDAMSRKEKELHEGKMISLLRNALLVAGTEMGENGDHWPVVKSTIHDIMKDWEDVKIERDVHEELRTQVYAQLAIMENELPNCTPAARKELIPILKELREIYDAGFAPASVTLDPEETPAHITRAKAILDTLEVDDVEA